jgi:WD40 repeat protein
LNKKKQRLVRAHKLHKKSIRKLAHPTNNSDLIFSASKDKSIKLTDLKHESNILTLDEAHSYDINFLQYQNILKVS